MKAKSVNILTDLINAMAGNSSKHGPTRNNRWDSVFCVVRVTPNAGNGPVNSPCDTWHVFSVWSTPSNSRTTGLCNPFVRNGSVNKFPCIGPCYATLWPHQQYRRYLLWSLCRELIREVNSEASSVQGSYESVVSWRRVPRRVVAWVPRFQGDWTINSKKTS
jgi:hypothetical protein